MRPGIFPGLFSLLTIRRYRIISPHEQVTCREQDHADEQQEQQHTCSSFLGRLGTIWVRVQRTGHAYCSCHERALPKPRPGTAARDAGTVAGRASRLFTGPRGRSRAVDPTVPGAAATTDEVVSFVDTPWADVLGLQQCTGRRSTDGASPTRQCRNASAPFAVVASKQTTPRHVSFDVEHHHR